MNRFLAILTALLLTAAAALAATIGPNPGQLATLGSGVAAALLNAINTTGGFITYNAAQSVNARTSSYTVATSDCNNVIEMGTGTSGLLTLTFPSVSGFPTACQITAYDGDTTRWKIVSNASGASWLFPSAVDGASVFRIVNGSWMAVSPNPRFRPSANPTFYVDQTNGSDANDCQSTTTSACKTFQGAFNLACTTVDNGPYITTIQAAGSETYTSGLAISGGATDNPSPICVGISNIIVDGGSSTISCSSCIPLYLRYAPFSVSLRNVTLTSSTSDDISVRGAGFVNLEQGVVIGAAGSGYAQVLVYGAGQLATCPPSVCSANTGGLTVTGGGSCFIQALEGGHAQLEGITIHMSGTPAYTQGFACGADNSGVSFFQTTIVGTNATGDQFSITKGMYLDIYAQTGGYTGCADTYLPGSTCGQTSYGARVSDTGLATVSGCGTGAVVQGIEPYINIVMGSGLPTTANTYVTGCTLTWATRSAYTACVAQANSVNLGGLVEALVAPTSSVNGGINLAWVANGTSVVGNAIYISCFN